MIRYILSYMYWPHGNRSESVSRTKVEGSGTCEWTSLICSINLNQSSLMCIYKRQDFPVKLWTAHFNIAMFNALKTYSIPSVSSWRDDWF